MKQLPLTRLAAEPAPGEFPGGTWFMLEREFHGTPAPRPLKYLLACSEKSLFFGFDSADLLVSDPLPAGTFRAGLWEKDVAELFLGYGKKYLEINLSPAGAWWSCLFTSPRCCAPGQPAPLAGVYVQKDPAKELVVLSVPLSEVESALAPLAELRGNVTAIFGTPRRYLSQAEMPAQPLDFHQPPYFLALHPEKAAPSL